VVILIITPFLLKGLCATVYLTRKNMLSKIFGKNKNIIIGAIHLPPLLGYPDFPGFDLAIENALRDAHALKDDGVDGVIFENNYDIPHTALVGHEIVAAMVRIGTELKQHLDIPLGVSVLWNDYSAALSIAKALELQFIRIPVFVDIVKTSYGVIKGEAVNVTTFRKYIGADTVALFTDIHVKHAELLSPEPISAAALRAVKAQADALIVTGKWTGDAPMISDLKAVREAVGEFPILCGSGVDESNVKKLFQYANGAIVSTSLKDDKSNSHAVNVKTYDARIDEQKTARLVRAAKASN
jgi:uncharacterized protein